MSYAGSAGDRVPALLRLAPGPGRLPAIVLGHGHGASAEDIADHLGEGFAGRAVHLLAPDHPFHGDRLRHERGDLCPDRPEVLVARWLRAVQDLRRAVAVLRQHPHVDPRRIGYVGFSLGGVLGGLLAAHEPDLAAAVLVAPAGSWKDLAASSSGWKLGWNRRLLPEWLKDPRLASLLATVDPARSIARFAPRPLLVVAGRRDAVIRPEAAEALHRAAGKGAEITFHPGGHGPGPRALRQLSEWILGKLVTAGPPLAR
jgi:dienelactone hydrolase